MICETSATLKKLEEVNLWKIPPWKQPTVQYTVTYGHYGDVA